MELASYDLVQTFFQKVLFDSAVSLAADNSEELKLTHRQA